ncbi:hypothetical protein BDN71DRAFT_490642 [Pleurotus eryngii]|uniref:Uncharacterized protein n=1 Tax=Pleurotus eryngii TaxID=5323 RepID=A0A9P6A7X1_PLEER|nr:hypothetical protein BDN71DRAFT_490642 [Pleurotus eryngii]
MTAYLNKISSPSEHQLVRYESIRKVEDVNASLSKLVPKPRYTPASRKHRYYRTMEYPKIYKDDFRHTRRGLYEDKAFDGSPVLKLSDLFQQKDTDIPNSVDVYHLTVAGCYFGEGVVSRGTVIGM